MSVKEEKVGPPPRQGLDDWATWYQWFNRISAFFPRTRTYSVSFTPTSVSANTTEEQTLTVTGVNTDDIVCVNPPSVTAGIIVGSARVSAANTVKISFGNVTAGGLSPPAGTYKVKATRG